MLLTMILIMSKRKSAISDGCITCGNGDSPREGHGRGQGQGGVSDDNNDQGYVKKS